MQPNYADTERGKLTKSLVSVMDARWFGVWQGELLTAIEFVLEHDLQLVCDEVYAGSVLSQQQFVSALQVASKHSQQAVERVHVVWGLAKVFCIR